LLQLGFGHADHFRANSVIHSKSTPNPVPKQLGGAAERAARRMYEGAGLGPEDVDTFNPYDGYAPMAAFTTPSRGG
jgi:hypothetical protein